MTNILTAASYCRRLYRIERQRTVPEVALQYFLYLAQMESLAQFDKPLFEEELITGEDGPYFPVVATSRNDESDYSILELPELLPQEKYLLEKTIKLYAKKPLPTLRDLVCRNKSWIRARERGEMEDEDNPRIELEDIRSDAMRVRMVDAIWMQNKEESDDNRQRKARLDRKRRGEPLVEELAEEEPAA